MKTNNGKTLAILAAIIAVVGLGIGFAAFTRTLTINGNITVTPTDTFNVAFDTATANSSCSCSSGSSCNKGTVAAATITGLTASLKAPGDYCNYSYVVKNTSGYVAYLNSITFANKLTCSASSGTTASLVTATCPYIIAYVMVAPSSSTATAYDASLCSTAGYKCATNNSSTNGTVSDISGVSIAKTSGTQKVFVKLVYESTTNYADGAFSVYPFGASASDKLSLKYDTVD